MKKKLSLLMIVFMAVAAFAIQVGKRASATTWTVAGNSTELFGSAWDPAATANDMTLNGDVYKWTKTDVALPAFTKVQFKVCGDHAWTVAFPAENYEFTIPENGKYTVVITFNAATEEITATATKTGDATFPDAEITKAQICGATDASWTNRIDFDLTKGEGNVYTGVLDASAYEDDVEFKLVVNGDTWIGFDQLTMNAPDGWVEKAKENDNFLLKNSSTRYKSYNITATWVSNALANKGWTVKIEGKEPRTKDVTISPASGDISEAINAELGSNYFAKNVTINLAENGEYTISKTIETASQVTIAGPATLAEGEKAPVINASSLDGALIKLAGSTTKAKKSDDTESTYLWYGNVAVTNLSITGLKKQLVQASETARIDQILLENSVVEMAGQVNVFDLGSAFYTDLTIKNSTIWGTTETNHNKYLIKTDGRCENLEKVDNVYPKDVTTSIINSTLYNIARGQKLNNSNGHMKGKTYNVQKMENSILVNVGTKIGNEVNGWCFGTNSANMKMSYKNNTYITLDAEDNVVNVSGWTDASKIGSDQSGTALTTNPGIAYAKAEAGDFTIGASTAQAKFKTGDPRWAVTYVAIYTITKGEITNGTVEVASSAAEGEKVYPTLTPDAGYAVDKLPVIKNAEGTDVTETITFDEDEAGLYFVMPAFNITVDYEFSKLYTITLPTETTNGTVTIVKPAEGNQSVAGKEIKLKVTGLADGYKVVVKNGDTDVMLNEGDHTNYDYYFTMPEGDVTISIVDGTGINGITVDGVSGDIFSDGKPVYNLSGQRVFKGYKGIVIKNGRKVVIK